MIGISDVFSGQVITKYSMIAMQTERFYKSVFQYIHGQFSSQLSLKLNLSTVLTLYMCNEALSKTHF